MPFRRSELLEPSEWKRSLVYEVMECALEQQLEREPLVPEFEVVPMSKLWVAPVELEPDEPDRALERVGGERPSPTRSGSPLSDELL